MLLAPDSDAFTAAAQAQTRQAAVKAELIVSANATEDSATASVVEGTSFNATAFPVSSIVNSREYKTGNPFAILGTDANSGPKLSPNTVDAATGPVYRLYSADGGMQYTHWISNEKSGAASPFSYNPDPSVAIDYSDGFDVNMVDARFEISQGKPDSIILYLKDSQGGGWVTNGTYSGANIVDSDGLFRIYRNPNGTWTQSPSAADKFASTETIYGVRIHVLSSDTANARVAVLGLDALRGTDITSDIISFSVNRSREQQEYSLPGGHSQSNSMRMTLSNVDNDYGMSASGLDAALIKRNAKIELQMGFETTNGTQLVPAGTWYVNNVSYSFDDHTTSIECDDYLRFLQEDFIDDFFIENKSLKWIIKELLGRSGYPEPVFEFGVGGNNIETNVIPYVWYPRETTLWDAITEILASEQGFLYMDEENNMIVTDRAQFDAYKGTTQWDIDSTVDMIQAANEFKVEANDINVKYTKLHRNIQAKVPEIGMNADGSEYVWFRYNVPIMSELWKPDGEVSIGAGELKTAMTAGSTSVTMADSYQTSFPNDEGIVRINDEYISYSSRSVAAGNLILSGLERGIYGSVARSHPAHQEGADPSYMVSDFVGETADNNPASYTLTHKISDGKLVMGIAPTSASTNAYAQYITSIPTGSASDSAFDYYGVRMRFEKPTGAGPSHGMAGIFINQQANGKDGVYFELVDEQLVKTFATNGYDIGTARFYTVDGGAPSGFQRSGNPNNAEGRRGFYEPIVNGFDYLLEVVRVSNTTYHVYINGNIVRYRDTGDASSNNNIAAVTVSAPLTTGNFGVFVRGKTRASFDFIYADDDNSAGPYRRDSDSVVSQDSTKAQEFMDININTSRYESEYLRNALNRIIYHGKDSFDVFYEFGSIVHEVRKFDVEFSKYPAVSARVFNTNVWESMVRAEDHRPFRSSFIIENIGRTNAVLAGVDADVVPGFPIDMLFFVYGQAVVADDERFIRITDSDSIRKYGKSSVEIRNPWIQSESQAKALAEYIRDNWSNPVDFVRVDWIPNPALQVGDKVQLSYPELGFDAAYRYHVIDMDISYDGGYSGNVLLRRVL